MTLRTCLRLCICCLAPVLLVGASALEPHSADRNADSIQAMDPDSNHMPTKSIEVHYLEIVTPLVNETCQILAQTHDVVFSQPIAELGNARTADLKGGGRIGVRAPMRATEAPVVRPYLLVDDIHAAVDVAKKAGAEVAIPPLEIPGQGTFSIYILGGIEHGLWQR